MVSAVPQLSGLSHVDLTVSDRHASERWYADLLGFEVRSDRFNEAAGLHWSHLVHPVCDLSIGLVEHADGDGMPFDERRVGLDHLSLAISKRTDLESLLHRVRELGYEGAAITETPRAAVLVLRDPDNIQIEVCLWKRADG